MLQPLDPAVPVLDRVLHPSLSRAPDLTIAYFNLWIECFGPSIRVLQPSLSRALDLMIVYFNPVIAHFTLRIARTRPKDADIWPILAH